MRISIVKPKRPINKELLNFDLVFFALAIFFSKSLC